MGKRLFVGSLPYDITDAQLKAAFAVCGTVVSARIIMDRETSKSKGFGFVEMSSDAEATAAVTKLNGSALGTRRMTVNEARPMGAPGAPRPGGPGGPGGFRPGGSGPGRPGGPGGGPPPSFNPFGKDAPPRGQRRDRDRKREWEKKKEGQSGRPKDETESVDPREHRFRQELGGEDDAGEIESPWLPPADAG